MIFNIFFSILWLSAIVYIRADYKRTDDKILLIAEVIVLVIFFVLDALYIRNKEGL